MARKMKLSDDDIENVEMDFDPALSGSKLPVDISGGKKPLQEYMELPLDLIDPYGDKRGTDFTSYDDALADSMLDSIKEYGVMEAITVRAKPDGRYELLAGERRWTYSKKAGKKTIPAHIMKADDKVARAVFSLTNILRRPTSYQNLIAGWWHFYLTLKESGALNTLRSGGISALSPDLQAQIGSDTKMISYRQMMRYVKMHDLVDTWVIALDNKETTLRIGQTICSLPQERQEQLLPHIAIIDEDKAKKLVLLNDGSLKDDNGTILEWTENNISNILKGQVSPRKKAAPKTESAIAFAKAKPRIMKAAEKELRPADYSRAEEVISEALKLYYAQTENA